jgi:mannose-1-phosphate guanylyltransferase
MQVVILCGGSGTRLWPISRTHFPKQFVKLFGEESLFQKTVSRNASHSKKFSVVINQEQYFMGLDQMNEMNASVEGSFILEPMGRNTAPAIALACLAVDPSEVLLVVPSDHLIENQAAYDEAVRNAVKLAQDNKLVTFGIKPTYAETGYGYIEASGNDVKSFKEKPDLNTAEMYLRNPNFSWNSGMFCFKAGVFLEELKAYASDIYEKSLHAYQNPVTKYPLRILPEDMQAIRSESIDYAVMEKSKLVKVVPADMGWNDLGSFDSLYSVLPQDADGNTKKENYIQIGSTNNLIVGDRRVISTIDVEDLMIVDTPDALMISKKGSTQKVKDLVALVKEAHPHLANVHTTAHTPWGSHSTLDARGGYKVKLITVRPESTLSLQFHNKRSEHWIVLSGTATVTMDDKTFELHQNESTFIPIGVQHRLSNLQKENLILIEVQVGNYLGEDDIMRLQS